MRPARSRTNAADGRTGAVRDRRSRARRVLHDPLIEVLAAIAGCEVVDDAGSLRLGWQAGGGVRLLRIEVDEHPEAVTVGAVVASGYVVTADWRLGFIETRLREPLGLRRLLDAASGRQVRRSLPR